MTFSFDEGSSHNFSSKAEKNWVNCSSNFCTNDESFQGKKKKSFPSPQEHPEFK